MSFRSIKTKLCYFIVAFIFTIVLPGSFCIAVAPEPPSHVRVVSLPDGVVKLWWDHSPSFDKGAVKAYRIYGKRKRDPLRNKVYKDKFKLYAEVDAKYQYWQSQPLKQIHICRSQGLSFKYPKQWFGDVELQPGLEYDFLVRAVGNDGQESRDGFVISKEDIPNQTGKYSNFTTKHPWWRISGGVGEINRNSAYYDVESGALWLGTAGGVMRYIMLENGKVESKLYAPVDGLVGYNVYTITKDRRGRFWFGTDAGISIYNPANERWKTYTAKEDGLTGEKVYYIIVHPQTDDVWLGTNTGVDQFSELGVKHFRGYKEYTVTEEGVTLEGLTRIVKSEFKVEMPEAILGMRIVRLNFKLFRKLGSPDEWLSIAELYEMQKSRVLPSKIQLKIPMSHLYSGVPVNATSICFERRHPHRVWVATSDGLSVIEEGKVTKTFETLPLFSIDSSFEKDLEHKNISKNLRKMFEYKGFPLSESATISIQSKRNRWMIADKNNRTYLVTLGWKRLDVYDLNFGLPDNDVEALLEDTQGRIWVSTPRAVSVIQDRQIIQTYGLGNNYLRPLLEDAQGRIWIATGSDVSVIEGGQIIQTYDIKTPGRIYNDVDTLLEDTQGRIWVGTGAGVSVIEDGKIIQTYDTTPGGIYNNVDALLEDTQGRIWIGTRNEIKVIEEEQISTIYDITKGIPSNYVNALLEDTQGRVWAGTSGGGVSVVEKKKVTQNFNTTTGLPDDYVYVLQEDKHCRVFAYMGNLSISKSSGSVSFGPGFHRAEDSEYCGSVSVIKNEQITKTFKIKFPEFSGKRKPWSTTTTQAFLFDSRGHIWVGTAGGGAHIIEKGKVTQTFNSTKGLPDDYVQVFLEDSNERIWVGTGAGIGVVEKGEVITTGLSDYTVTSLLEDRGGRIWVGTGNGGAIVIKKGQVVQTFNLTNGLDNRVEAFLEDSRGSIWVGTGAGVSIIQAGEVIKTTVLEDNLVVTLLEDKRGRIWAGTAFGGLNVINPHQPLTLTVKAMFVIFLALCVSFIGYEIYVRYQSKSP